MGLMLKRWKQWRIKYWQGSNSPLYGGVFLGIWSGLAVLYWSALEWRDESWVLLLAAMVGVSAGATLAINILVEVVGSMLQLIPKVREAIRADAKAEGLAEGEAIGVVKGRAEVMAWLERKAAAERAGLPFDEPPPG